MTGTETNNLRDSVASMPGATMPPDRTTQGVGKLAGEYKCYFQNAKGKLYAGSDGVFFLGMMFFFEKQISIRWVDVIKIIKGAGGLMIVVPDANHEFTDVPNLDRCWATLVALHSDALMHGRGDETTPSSSPSQQLVTPTRATLRRTNSDPLSEVRHSIENESSGEETCYMAAASIANLKEAREEVRISSMKRPAYKSFKVPKDRMIPLEESESVDIEEDLADAWAQLQEPCGDEGYSDVAVKDHVLECDMERFYELFIADAAPHSIASFHEADGDTELRVTNWEPEEEGSPFFTRSFEYNHPVNAPLAPPMARAKKEQRFRRFAEHGMVIETDTFVEDVPMADCFYVRDRVLVEPQGDKILLVAEFDIRFVKSTMFRSIIVNTTRAEFIKYFKDYLAFITEIAEGKPPPEKAEARPLPPPAVAAPKAALAVPVSTTQIMILLLVIVLFIQIWMMMQMQSMMRSMLDMQEKLMEACPATSI